MGQGRLWWGLVERGRRVAPSLDRPAVVALLGCAFALAVGLAGLGLHHWDAGRFVTAGSEVADPATVPDHLAVSPGTGYDGQYFYRLALNPLTGRRTEHGISLDDPAYRQQRILYPALAWVMSLGRAAWVPAALLAVNVAALAALGIAGGALAASLGRHRLWGLAIPLYPGFTMSLFRDLSEIVAVALLMTALVALRRGGRLVPTVCLAAAVLTRETTIVVPLAGLGYLAWRRLAGQDRGDAPPSLPFVVPVVVFALWEVILRLRWGTFPLVSGGGSATVPLSAATRRVADAVAHPSGSSLRLGLEIVAVLGCLSWALVSLRRRGGEPPSLRPYEVAAFVLYVGLAAVLARDVWAEDWSFVRVLSEAMAVAVVVVLSGPRRDAWWLILAGGGLWLLVGASIVAT